MFSPASTAAFRQIRRTGAERTSRRLDAGGSNLRLSRALIGRS
jgi:hypothetical protein